MTRQPAEISEDAFRVWATSGEQNDRKTAELTGIPLSTVGYYRRQYRWSERWQEVVSPEADIASNQARQMLRLGSPLVARRLLRIIGGQKPLINAEGNIVTLDGQPVMIDEAEHKDALVAAKLMAAYNWGDPRNVVYEPNPETSYGTVLPAQYTTAEGQEIGAPEGEETVEALKAGVSALIEATVQSVNTRTKSRPGRRRV